MRMDADMRPMYAEHIDVFRHILQVSIVVTFLLGAISISFIRSKAFGAIATLMGGSKVEPVATTARPFSAGLDYFVLELLILALLFIPMERIWALREQKIFRTGWQTDVKHWPKRYGTVKFQPPETWWGQFVYPFKRKRATPYG